MSTMRAVVQDGYGGTEVLRREVVPLPQPGPGEVLVQVQAAAIDRGTWHVMTGLPRVARLGLGLRRPKARIPGLDVAGVVEAVGPDVTGFTVGQQVFGIARGSLAEHAVARASKLAASPTCLTPVESAALGVSGLTAIQALDAARVTAQSTVLVIGASGGVGSLAVKLAAARGAHVTAVCSGSKAETVRAWGAARVLDHRRAELDGETGRYDAVLDIAGGASLARLRALAADRGTIVFVGREGGGEWTGGFGAPLRRTLRMAVSRQRYVMLVARERSADLVRLAELADRDGLRPHLHATFAFDDVRAAMDELTSGGVIGKIALVPA